MAHRQYSIEHRTQQKEECLLYLTVSSYDGKWQSMPHTHSFCELFFVTEGEGFFSINEQRYPVRKNNFVIVNPHVIHTESIREDQSLSYIVLGIENLKFEGEEQPVRIYDFSEQSGEICALFDLMIEEMRKKESDYERVLQLYLKALLLKIERHTHYRFHSTPSKEISSECLNIKEYITENYNQNITLDALAKMHHRSRFHISRTFSEAFGISPMHYLAEIRILAAKNLLITSDFTIQQIVEMTGFSSSVYFSQAFKKSTGLSPRKFRQQAAKKD